MKKITAMFTIMASSLLITACGGQSSSSAVTADGQSQDPNDPNNTNLVQRIEIKVNGNDSSVFYNGRSLVNAVSAGSDKEDDLIFEVSFPNEDNDGLIEIVDQDKGTFRINGSQANAGKVIDFDLKITNTDRIDEKTGEHEVDVRFLRAIVQESPNSGNYSYQLYKNSVDVDLDLSEYTYVTASDIRSYVLPLNYRVHLSRSDIDNACKNVKTSGKFTITENQDNSFTCFYFKKPAGEVDLFSRDFIGDVISIYFYKDKIVNTVVYYDEPSNKIKYKTLLEDWYNIPEYLKESDPAVANKNLYEKSNEFSIEETINGGSQKLPYVFTNKGLVITSENVVKLFNTFTGNLEVVDITVSEGSTIKWIDQNNTSNSIVLLESNGDTNKVWKIKKDKSSEVLIQDLGKVVDSNIVQIKGDIVSMINENGINKIKLNNTVISENIAFTNNNGFINDGYSELYIPIVTNGVEKIYKLNNNQLSDIGVNIGSMKNEITKLTFVPNPLTGGSLVNEIVHSDTMSFSGINYNDGGYHIDNNTIYLKLNEKNNANHEEIYDINSANNITRFINDKIESGSSVGSIDSMEFRVYDINYTDNLIYSYHDNGTDKISFSNNYTLNKKVNNFEAWFGNNKNILSINGEDFYQSCDNGNQVTANNAVDQNISGTFKDVSMIDGYVYFVDNNNVKSVDINNTNCN